MKVTITADVSNKENPIEFVLTNESLDNPNFVDILVDDNEYTVSVQDLYEALMPFNHQRKEYRDE